MEAMNGDKGPSVIERVVRGVISAFCFTVFSFSVYYTFTVTYPRLGLPWYRAAFYLTQWQTRMHGVYSLLNLLSQLGLKWPSKNALARIYSVVFDLTALVTAVFWTMWAIDPRLILPDLKNPAEPWKEYPFWVCHAHHTMPFVSMAIEGLLFPRSLNVRVWSVVGESVSVVGVALVYMAWVFIGVYGLKIWNIPYGFLMVDTNLELAGRLAALSLVLVILVVILRGIRLLFSLIYKNTCDDDHEKKD